MFVARTVLCARVAGVCLCAIGLASVGQAATLHVCASGCTYTNLQPALDAAQPGDTILLRAGETFVGNFVLPAKSASATQFITIRSDAPDSALPASGVRLVPEGYPGANANRSALARILGAGGALKSTPLLSTDSGAHHYLLQFIDFDGAAQVGYETLIAIGTDKADANPPHDIVFDRVFVHGHPTKGQKRGIALNGKSTDVLNSYICDIKAVNTDSQAIAGWNGPGPFRIVNDYIEAAGENILFGGARPMATGLIPSDIEISRNHILKDPAWRSPILAAPGSVKASASSTAGALSAGVQYFRVVAVLKSVTAEIVSGPSSEVSVSVSAGKSVNVSWTASPGAESYRVYRGTTAGGESRYLTTSGASTSLLYKGSSESSGTPPSKGSHWVAKNLLELKNGQRVTIDGNLLENNWSGDQPGYAVVLTPRNYENIAPWAAVRDVTFSSNTLRHTAGAFDILGYDDTEPSGSQLTERITIRNNLFEIDPAAWGGGGTKCFLLGQGAADVLFDRNTIVQYTTSVVYAYGATMPRFTFTNNIALSGKYGIIGAGAAPGLSSIDIFFPNATITHNVLAGARASLFPPDNAFPTVDQWNASFVDAAAGDYRLLDSSVFYAAGSGGSVPGATLSASGPIDVLGEADAPVADAGGPYAARTGASVAVSGAASTASGGTITNYLWRWADDVVIDASAVPSANLHGNWQKASVSGAANGTALVNPNKGAAKITTPLASPASYVDVTFQAAAGVPYSVWFRARAQNDDYGNDSFYLQFSDARDAAGAPIAGIGTTDALDMVLEEGRGAGVSGWGWNDANYGSLAAPVRFATSGAHTLRLQPREDGVEIDQIVISSVKYAGKRPGATRSDTTIVAGTLGTSAGVSASHTYVLAGGYPLQLTVTDQNAATASDTTTVQVSSAAGPVADAGGAYSGTAGDAIVLDGSRSSGSIASAEWRFYDDILLDGDALASGSRHGTWKVASDTSASDDRALEDPDSGTAKIATALASPRNYVDIAFTAAAGVPYRLWLRMRAEDNSWNNDSVYVQFNDSVTASGGAVDRIGTTSALAVVLEEGKGAGVSGWGWNDADYGAMAKPVYFATSGTHTLRVQRREDGCFIDQIVLSAGAYYDDAPGVTRGDRTIVPATLGTAATLTATHVYPWAGLYPVSLEVFDAEGDSSTDTTTVTVR
ncbi:MAG TPA: hypothetical protein VFX12_04510 [Vicinamibacterales bacterium]|nr:hypothetical protein [Vicinamibacterales bacterium]